MALSESQKISLAVVPKISSCLSIFGSAWIVLEVAGDREKQKQMYHRLMGMFALVDGIVSVFYFLSTWPMHDDNDDDVVWSQGSTSTCRLQGFFVQFGSSAFIYYAVLTTYFVLVIRFGVKDETLAKYEILFHLIPIGFGLSTATAALAKDWFNNATVWCWLAGFDQEDAYRWAFYYGPLFFCLLFVTVVMFGIYRVVYMKEKESLRFHFESHKHLVSPYMYQSPNNSVSNNPDITMSTEGRTAPSKRVQFSSESLSDCRTSLSQQQQQDLEEPTNIYPNPQSSVPSLPPVGELSGPEVSIDDVESEPAMAEDSMMDEQERKRTRFVHSVARLNNLRRKAAKSKRRLRWTRQVAIQAVLYVIAFYLTFAPVVLDRIYQQVHGSPLYPLLLLHVMLTPLQGLSNLIIYRRQYMVQLRNENPSWSWLEVLSRSLDNSSLQRLRESKGGGTSGTWRTPTSTLHQFPAQSTCATD